MLIEWLASELGLSTRAVKPVRGESSPLKWLEIDAPADRVAAWLATVLD